MKAQTIFNRAARGLLKQGERSWKIYGAGCAYRGASGRRCGIGFTFPDRLYQPGMEVCGRPSRLFERYPKLKKYLGPENLPLLESIQLVHDNNDPLLWKQRLQEVANDHRLSSAVLEEGR